MKTSVEINEEKLRLAKRLSHTSTKREIIDKALDAYIARVRRLEESSRAGIAMLGESAQPCIETARILYCGIVDAVEEIDFEVFSKRATVSLTRRLRIAVPAYLQARKLWKQTI
jgi:phytoene synthase